MQRIAAERWYETRRVGDGIAYISESFQREKDR